MICNNFFQDILKSFVHLFEDYIFNYRTFLQTGNVLPEYPESYIKSYQFNIGTRAFMIGDYKEANKVRFPSASITLLNDESAFGTDTSLIQHHRRYDVNEQLVLFCPQNKRGVWLREAQNILYFQVAINCESVLSAKEVEHQIKRFLPPQKYVTIMEYRSFMQLPSYFITSEFNPQHYKIVNLFEEVEPTIGDGSYFYSIKYKPILKLDSIQADISDPMARSYTVSCDFSYLIPYPVWLYSDKEPDQIERINLGLTMEPNGPGIMTTDVFQFGTDRIEGEHALEVRRVFLIKGSSSSIRIGEKDDDVDRAKIDDLIRILGQRKPSDHLKTEEVEHLIEKHGFASKEEVQEYLNYLETSSLSFRIGLRYPEESMDFIEIIVPELGLDHGMKLDSGAYDYDEDTKIITIQPGRVSASIIPTLEHSVMVRLIRKKDKNLLKDPKRKKASGYTPQYRSGNGYFLSRKI